MDDRKADRTAELALLAGGVAIGSVCSLAVYFAVGGPFGTINDLGNATTGVLSACLAWRLRSVISGRRRTLSTAAAVAGGALTVAGSALVLSGTTSFVLAGLVSGVGFAAIGAWLIVLNAEDGTRHISSRRTRGVGATAGALMLAGIVGLPAITLRLDDMTSLPASAWVAFVAWLGTYVVYPAWAIAFGLAPRQARDPRPGTSRTITSTLSD